MYPPSQPVIIFAWGFDDNLDLFEPLRTPHWSWRAIIPGMSAPEFSHATWDGKRLYVNGHCPACGYPLAPPGSIVVASLPEGLAYAMRVPHPVYNHMARPVYIPRLRVFALAVVLFATYPALAFIRGPVRRWRRRKRGLCIHCGYNLTGLTEARCPECGQAMSAGNPPHGV